MPDAVTDGLLYRKIDADSLRCLDDYEDDFYERTTVTVSIASGSELAAECYVIPPRHYSWLLPRPWSLEHFRAEALVAYLERILR